MMLKKEDFASAFLAGQCSSSCPCGCVEFSDIPAAVFNCRIKIVLWEKKTRHQNSSVK